MIREEVWTGDLNLGVTCVIVTLKATEVSEFPRGEEQRDTEPWGSLQSKAGKSSLVNREENQESHSPSLIWCR